MTPKCGTWYYGVTFVIHLIHREIVSGRNHRLDSSIPLAVNSPFKMLLIKIQLFHNYRAPPNNSLVSSSQSATVLRKKALATRFYGFFIAFFFITFPNFGGLFRCFLCYYLCRIVPELNKYFLKINFLKFDNPLKVKLNNIPKIRVLFCREIHKHHRINF